MKKLSATIITLDEEKNIERCLKSLEGLVDEVVVVDCGSTDETVEIAKKMGARVFFHKFINFADQKNFALSKAEGEWIFSIDADEEVSAELREEIKKVIQSDEFVAYSMPRRNFILGKEIKHTGWSPDRHIWLWKKNLGSWEGEVHEEVIAKGEVGELKEGKIHYASKRLKDFVEANNHYSDLESLRLHNSGVRFSYLNMYKYSIREFLVRFVYRMGFLDGWRGLILSVLMADYKRMVWMKLLEKEQISK